MTMRRQPDTAGPPRTRKLWKVAAVAFASAALTVTLVAPAAASPDHGGHQTRLPSRIPLPTGFLPEGITIGKGPIAYLGSRADGDIYAANLRTGKGRVISQGPGTSSVGLKIRGDRLYVAGGAAGNGRVVSVRTGAVLASYSFVAPTTPDPSFVNDVVLAKRRAWFTDSLHPQLYSVSYARNAAKAKVTTLPVTGDWVQTAGVINANGIALSPNERSLLVVQSNTGFLFRVNPKTGVARRVDLGGTLLTDGDGLLVRGRTLYAVQNQLNQIAVVHLNKSGTRGRLVDTLTSADLPRKASFDVPTTVAFYKGNLYLPNARFNNKSPATADYWITRIRP
jgi:hypothetical protein